MKNILLIAPPAGGKGTVSEELVKKCGYVHISTGDLLRNLDVTTELGKKIHELIGRGELAPDDLVLELLKDKIDTLKGRPYILDGCPRNLFQARELEKKLTGDNKLDLAIYMNVPYEVCLKRIVGRMSCSKCGRVYNRDTSKPKVEWLCDDCKVELTTRKDDTEETFKGRYETFTNTTYPIVDFYKEKNKLVEIDGLDDPYEKIVEAAK